MNRMLKTIVVAAAATAATWAMRRWIDIAASRNARKQNAPPVHSWENEGGALAPQPFNVETSQVPR